MRVYMHDSEWHQLQSHRCTLWYATSALSEHSFRSLSTQLPHSRREFRTPPRYPLLSRLMAPHIHIRKFGNW
jgi:hypothetical protein